MGLRVKVLGNVALLRVSNLDDKALAELGEAIHESKPEVRAVIAYRGVSGPFRLPEAKLIWGEMPSSVIHKEYGVEFELDPLRVMFCLGNSFERLRIAMSTRSWEVVVDMFAGVGQFTIPIAVHASPRKVYAVEINREAYEFLRCNVARNRVGDIVETYLADCRDFASEVGSVADRVVMGYFGDTLNYLSSALQLLGPAGGVIHIHDVVRRGSLEGFSSLAVSKARELGYRAEKLKARVVKSYSPSKQHVVVDLFALKDLNA